MVWIEVRAPDGAILKVLTGARIGAEGASQRLRIPDNLRNGPLDPADMPATWPDWVAANPQHPRAQLLNANPTDPQQRQYIYNPNNRGFRLVSGTPNNDAEAANICAARELNEETGFDVTGALDRLTPLPGVGGVPAFRVDATAAECAAITALLTQRIQARMGEVFDFIWEAPAPVQKKSKLAQMAAEADAKGIRSTGPRKYGGRKTRRSKRSRRTRRR